MSWAAHQFEGYVLQRHFGERFDVSYLAIVAGDAVPDFFAKAWVYGLTVNGTRYGAGEPADFHRGWPGVGFTHSLAFGLVFALVVWTLARHRPWATPWALGLIIGQWAHAITDVNDSKGTMLLFPLTTHNFSIGTWSYGAQVGEDHDAAAYFSSLGFATDVVWLLVLLLFARQVLSRRYFEEVVQGADPAPWAWLGRHFPDVVLVALYRAMFFYGVTRLAAWSVWAHVITDHDWDLTWGGPYWLVKVPASTQSVWWLLIGSLGVAAAFFSLWRIALHPRRHVSVEEGPWPLPASR